MRRRELLGLVGTSVGGLVGCLTGESGSAGTDTADATPTAESTSTADEYAGTTEESTATAEESTSGESAAFRRVELGAVDDGSLRSAGDVAGAVEVTEPSITATGTARVEVTLENRADAARTLTYVTEVCDLTRLVGAQRDGSARLLLVAADWDLPDGSCPRPDPRNLSCGIPAREQEVELDPGATRSWTLTLWVPPDAEECAPPGIYRFEWTFRVGDSRPSVGFALDVTADS